MKVIMLVLFSVSLLFAQFDSGSFTVYPTKNGIRDYSVPGMRYDAKSSEIYQTYPGTDIKDYSKPGYEIEHDRSYKPNYQMYGTPEIKPVQIPQLQAGDAGAPYRELSKSINETFRSITETYQEQKKYQYQLEQIERDKRAIIRQEDADRKIYFWIWIMGEATSQDDEKRAYWAKYINSENRIHIPGDDFDRLCSRWVFLDRLGKTNSFYSYDCPAAAPKKFDPTTATLIKDTLENGDDLRAIRYEPSLK